MKTGIDPQEDALRAGDIDRGPELETDQGVLRRVAGGGEDRRVSRAVDSRSLGRLLREHRRPSGSWRATGGHRRAGSRGGESARGRGAVVGAATPLWKAPGEAEPAGPACSCISVSGAFFVLIVCPSCRHAIRVVDLRPGRFTPRCPRCDRVFQITVPEEKGQSPSIIPLDPSAFAEPVMLLPEPEPAVEVPHAEWPATNRRDGSGPAAAKALATRCSARAGRARAPAASGQRSAGRPSWGFRWALMESRCSRSLTLTGRLIAFSCPDSCVKRMRRLSSTIPTWPRFAIWMLTTGGCSPRPGAFPVRRWAS